MVDQSIHSLLKLGVGFLFMPKHLNRTMPLFAIRSCTSGLHGVDGLSKIVGHPSFFEQFLAPPVHHSSVERISTTADLVGFPVQTLALHVAIVLVFTLSTTQQHVQKLGRTTLSTHRPRSFLTFGCTGLP